MARCAKPRPSVVCCDRSSRGAHPAYLPACLPACRAWVVMLLDLPVSLKLLCCHQHAVLPSAL